MNSVQTPWDEPVSHRRKKKYFQSWILCSILDTYFRVRWNEFQMWLWSKAARSDFDSRKSGDESHHRKFQHCSGNCLLWLWQTELGHMSQRLSPCLSAQFHPEVVAAKRHGRNWALVTDRQFSKVSHSHRALASPLHVLAECISSTHLPWCGLLSQTPASQLAAPQSSPGNLFGKAYRDTAAHCLTQWQPAAALSGGHQR